MSKFFKKNLGLISFIFIPIIYLGNPAWMGLLGIQPYWPLFWLLPWAMLYGPVNGLIVGLFLGLALDSIGTDTTFTQIPGLILCGIWFGNLGTCQNAFIGHLRYGLICSFGSFLCSMIYFAQILIKNLSYQVISLYFHSIQNVLAQVFITGLMAPLLCTIMYGVFQRSKENRRIITFSINK